MTNLALSETIETLHPRVGDRRRVAVAGRLTWRDTNGALRFASVVTRDVSDADVFVECQAPASIPKFRLVHFQVERAAQGRTDLPAVLRAGKQLTAIYRVGPCEASTGTPKGYALRLLNTPSKAKAAAAPTPLALAN